LIATSGPLAQGAVFPATDGSVTGGAVVAFKVVEESGVPALQPAWVSRDIPAAAPPLVINGVVFALASGEARGAEAATAAQRIQRSRPAVLYALDAATGKALWNSGTSIASFSHGTGPVGGDGTVLVVTFDGTVYAFSHPVER
jgi:outer membrane protein assembly factor BamB